MKKNNKWVWMLVLCCCVVLGNSVLAYEAISEKRFTFRSKYYDVQLRIPYFKSESVHSIEETWNEIMRERSFVQHFNYLNTSTSLALQEGEINGSELKPFSLQLRWEKKFESENIVNIMLIFHEKNYHSLQWQSYIFQKDKENPLTLQQFVGKEKWDWFTKKVMEKDQKGLFSKMLTTENSDYYIEHNRIVLFCTIDVQGRNEIQTLEIEESEVILDEHH
ncbi:MAG: hypothetical protein ACRCWQ_03285 [Bacilli bacterium]